MLDGHLSVCLVGIVLFFILILVGQLCPFDVRILVVVNIARKVFLNVLRLIILLLDTLLFLEKPTRGHGLAIILASIIRVITCGNENHN